MSKWTNRDRVLQKMSAIPPEMRDALKKALATRAKLLAQKIRPRIPYDPTPDGREHLRNTLDIYPGGGPNTDKTKADPDLTIDIQEGGRVKGEEYVRFIEFGTQNLDPQPHFYPTYRLEKANILRALRRAIKQSLRKIWGRT